VVVKSTALAEAFALAFAFGGSSPHDEQAEEPFPERASAITLTA
jgi:hypothetical protein